MNEATLERKVYYHHTDAGGVVYYANYLLFLEEGRTEYLRQQGLDTATLINQDIQFPVVHVDIDYKAPARYGDIVRIITEIERIGNASIQFSQRIERDNIVLVQAKTVWACVGSDFKTKPVPEFLKTILREKLSK